MNSKVVPIAVISIAVVLVLSVVILGQDNITGKAVGDVTYYCWGDSAADFQISTSATKPYSWYRAGSWNPYCFTSTNTCNNYCKGKGFASGAVGSNAQQCVCSGSEPSRSPGNTCTDSDVSSSYPDGKNYGLKGIIALNGKVYDYEDRCEGSRLYEYYCNTYSQDVASEMINCPSGQACSEGACVCTNGCSVAGAIQCSGNSKQTCGNYDSDSCLEWGATVACPAGQTCNSGTCTVAGAIATYWCCGGSATDYTITKDDKCNGVGYYTKKPWTNNVCFGHTCQPWCVSQGYVYGTANADIGGCVCSNSRPSCTDTDKTSANPAGINYAIKGTIIGDKSGGTYTDTCSGNQLREYYCKGDDWADSTYYTCPSGQACRNGACVSDDPNRDVPSGHILAKRNHDDFEKGEYDCYTEFYDGTDIVDNWGTGPISKGWIIDTANEAANGGATFTEEYCFKTGNRENAGTNANIKFYLTENLDRCLFNDGTGAAPSWYAEYMDECLTVTMYGITARNCNRAPIASWVSADKFVCF